MFKYLHNNRYHTDTTTSYMSELGLSEEAQESIRTMKEYEQNKETVERVLFKHQRQKQLDNLTVEVDGMVFDGDEASQGRMNRASFSMQEGETIGWVLANNEEVMVTKEQLAKALRLAGARQAEFWAQGEQE
ncbi:hypothetical protein J8Z28_07810 [Pseudoalteromonas sp. SCSIO 43088]|uniref:DUF4376 domain-containing protein n=1 Tax=Pseudoalteromonas sp. SCSIO 43088 TaxID=2822846 RepID=UPI00202ACB77|nr:DUF4376 domain-containing protein [Pseudoalteromonas sp. SCSIO 43088]URQ87737.1 hypothetical protein J8Z28_07810 [Pseudoalteromonas sp. SCSIO 43088]